MQGDAVSHGFDMAKNCLASVFLLFLISGQDLFAEGQEYHEINSNCPDLSESLGDGCTLSSDCSTITCKLNFGQKDITLKVKINKCESPVTITTTMKVPDLYIDWSHEYSSGDIVKVPGFTFTLPGGFASVGVYVQVDMKDNGDQLVLTVKLLAGAEISDKGVYPVKTKVLDGKLPISTDECGIIRWWNESSDAIKAVVIIGGVILLFSFIACCYCCCCRSKPASRGGVVVTSIPPAAGIVTTTNTANVPMNNYARFP